MTFSVHTQVRLKELQVHEKNKNLCISPTSTLVFWFLALFEAHYPNLFPSLHDNFTEDVPVPSPLLFAPAPSSNWRKTLWEEDIIRGSHGAHLNLKARIFSQELLRDPLKVMNNATKLLCLELLCVLSSNERTTKRNKQHKHETLQLLMTTLTHWPLTTEPAPKIIHQVETLVFK